MNKTADYYLEHPMIHCDRRRSNADSAWVRSFSCEDLKPLIVCRGPIRKEAMDVFAEMGIRHYGILLSEKDSIVYTDALAPELRQLRDPDRIHRVPDYSGASKEERSERIQQIISIAKDNGYDSLFAGYGFMAEDVEFVSAIEKAGLRFIGPCSHTQSAAGRKDEAKRTALSVDVSVIPGIDNVTAKTLVTKYPDRSSLLSLIDQHDLALQGKNLDALPLEPLADAILNASYAKGIDLFTIDELCAQVEKEMAQLFLDNPGSRIRLKAIGGGGGKGQRILGALELVAPEDRPAWAAKHAAKAPEMVREILNEVKASGVGDNKNVLMEMNIETTRHNEIQLVGNGKWCIALGGRDCSLQMHEQKLLEVSITQEELKAAVASADAAGDDLVASTLRTDLHTLEKMEAEAERFGAAVLLDSASTFECIVDRDRHFFMEMNTRIQVEHRVTELCYALKFTNPDNPQDSFVVYSLVEMMAMLTKHKDRLPRPERILRQGAAVESRLNATNQALTPHAGGMIRSWSDPIAWEIRDDQGISLKNPDTQLFMKYKVAGAYDSNIALLVTYGDHRQMSYERLAEILRKTKLRGTDLATNLEFHYGLVHWFLGQNVMAKPTTRFVVPYLTQVGLLKEEAAKIDPSFAFEQLKQRDIARAKSLGGEHLPQRLAAIDSAYERKRTFLIRPLSALFAEPHVLSGWLSKNRKNFKMDHGCVRWLKNPYEILQDTYDFLNMSFLEHAPASEVIWAHDNDLLQKARQFYAHLRSTFHLALEDYDHLHSMLQEDTPQGPFRSEEWAQIQSAHFGFQMGIELLGLAFLIAEKTGFYALRILDNLDIDIPEKLHDPELQARMKKVLVPPPPNKADEIVAVSGGMYYGQEAPGMPPFISEGAHFDKGAPLYIIEVMKMFNKVYAPFAGTVDKMLIETDGTIVAKGQPLFKITPDEKVEAIDPRILKKERQENTISLMSCLLSTLNQP